MKLTDLRPRWWVDGEGRHGMGVSFDCPHCRTQRLAVAFANPIDGGAPERLVAHRDGLGHVTFNCDPEWKRTGDTFETLTLTPSIDTSHAGHWHGFITNGEAA